MSRDVDLQLVQRLVDVRTANALDLPIALVVTVNRIERNHGSIEVELDEHGAWADVTYRDGDEWEWTVRVLADGSLDYTLGGAMPSRARFNKPVQS